MKISRRRIRRIIWAALGLALATAAALVLGWQVGAQNPVKRVLVGSALVQAEVVGSQEKLARGLSGRAALAEGMGMLFLMPERKRQTFWMQGMRFPLDIIWIDEGRIIGLEREVPPGGEHIVTSPGSATQVLEVPAGFSRRHGLKPGDKVVIGK